MFGFNKKITEKKTNCKFCNEVKLCKIMKFQIIFSIYTLDYWLCDTCYEAKEIEFREEMSKEQARRDEEKQKEVKKWLNKREKLLKHA